MDIYIEPEKTEVWVARRVVRRTTHNININELLTSLRDKGVSLLVHGLVKELGLRYSFARVTSKQPAPYGRPSSKTGQNSKPRKL